MPSKLLPVVVLLVSSWFAFAALSVHAVDDDAVVDSLTEARRASQVVESTRAVAKGQVTVIRTSATANREVMIHFHGAVETMRTALARSNFDGTLIIVNFSGLSSAYSKPFETDANLFDRLLQMVDTAQQNDLGQAAEQVPNVTLSSFSAGYGSIREILSQPRNFDRVSAIVTADSIYAGLVAGSIAGAPERIVSQVNMQDFLRFATLASRGEKKFVLSHSSQPTSYASTTETADYLLHSLSMSRTSDTDSKSGALQSVSQATRGRFTVLGFAGESAEDHLQHLRNIDLFWQRCFAE